MRRRGVGDLEDRNLQRQVVTRLFVERPDIESCRTGAEIFEISEALDIPLPTVAELLRETIRHYESLLPGRGSGANAPVRRRKSTAKSSNMRLGSIGRQHRAEPFWSGRYDTM